VKPTSSFFVAFRVLPPERRRAIEAVYGFCRRADDAVDEAPDAATAARSLARVRAEIHELFAGAAGRTGELGAAIARFGLPREPFEHLLEGVQWDLEGRRYETTAELREYCRRVASSVGRLCVRIFGCPGSRGDAYADELGVALQWTNILRDLGSDLAKGRVYVPAASLARHGLTAEDLARPAGEIRGRIAALVRAEAAYARECFAAAERALHPEDRPRVLSGRIMGAVYEALLTRVEWAGAAVLESRVRLPALSRAAVALRVVAAERAREWAGTGR
jgi:phytoene synthase